MEKIKLNIGSLYYKVPENKYVKIESLSEPGELNPFDSYVVKWSSDDGNCYGVYFCDKIEEIEKIFLYEKNA